MDVPDAARWSAGIATALPVNMHATAAAAKVILAVYMRHLL